VTEVPGAPASRAALLIVDDEEGVRLYFRTILEQAGYRVLEAANGREAVSTLEREPIDLMITDLVMPDQEGLETVQKLRSRGRNLKIIAISGAASSYLRVARILGADETLPKPVLAEELLAAVDRVLGLPFK
jgi:CheY-like chemotaxis protein